LSESRSDPAERAGSPRVLLRNTAFNIRASGVNLVVGVVLSPVLLAALGLERFGLWSLIWAITGSLGLLDGRVGAAVTPLAAMAWARGERTRLGRLMGTGLAFYLVLGLAEVGGALLWARTPLLMAWIPEPLREEGRVALVAAVGVFALNSVTSVYTGLLQGLQRFDLAARVVVVMTPVRAAILIAVAWAGGRLPALFFAEASIACVQCVVSVWVVHRQLPELRFPGRPDAHAMTELLGFGGKLLIAYLGHLVTFNADKMLLSLFLDLAAVAYYELGSKICYVVRGLPLLLISATMPVASAMEAAGNRDRLWKFFVTGTRTLVFVATPLFLFTATGASKILLAWVGVNPLEACETIWVLSLGYFLNVVTMMAAVVAVGMGRPEIEMRRSLLAAILNLGLSAGLIRLIGFAGAPLGTTLALSISSWYLMRTFSAQFGRSLAPSFQVFWRLTPAALPAAAGALLLVATADAGRVRTLLELAGAGLFIGTVYTWLGVREEIIRWEWIRSITARVRWGA